jgi:hypothetical protein
LIIDVLENNTPDCFYWNMQGVLPDPLAEKLSSWLEKTRLMIGNGPFYLRLVTRDTSKERFRYIVVELLANRHCSENTDVHGTTWLGRTESLEKPALKLSLHVELKRIDEWEVRGSLK